VSKIQVTDQFTIEAIKEILESGHLDKFIGKIEGACFEAKQSKPYFIDSQIPSDRFTSRIELAGDVAAMANAQGGYIVCGLPTQKEEELQTDKVIDINLTEETAFYSQDQVDDVIKAHVYPELSVNITWHPSQSNPKLGIGSIHIPSQLESLKYFIVNAVEINGVKQKHFVAIPERQGSEPIWISAKQLYRQVASRKPNEIKQVHDSLSAQLAELKYTLSSDQKVNNPADDIQNKIKEVLDDH
jgi:hypothetical protein